MTDQTSRAVEGPLDATVRLQAARMVRDMKSRPPHQQPPWMRADPAVAPAGMLFLPGGAKWAEVVAELHAVAARYLEKAKLARASAKRYRARGDLVRWRKACAVARVWEMAHANLEMVACPF
jgi:hypothetical protein